MAEIKTPIPKREILERALFYESQYRNAILSNAISYYDVNLSKDIIETEILYKNSKGEFYSTLELIGMTSPCSFSLFIEKWAKNMVTPINLEKYPFFKDVRQHLIRLFNEGKREYQVDYWITSKTGKKIFLNQIFLLTTNEFGEICALSIVKDHTEQKSKEENLHKKELEQYAYYDPVTHGYNYIKFKSKLKTINKPGSIISLDIHSFKIINSICGIIKGDEVIRYIWKNLQEIFDFENGDLAGHINADHFIIFVPTFDQDVIIRKLKNMTLSLSIASSELSVPNLIPYYGIAKWEPNKKIELAYSESVAAKHNAKELKNLNYNFFDEEDNNKLIIEKQIIDSFEDALSKKEFKIWYQPKFNPLNGKLIGAEALVRWEKADGTICSPSLFIPIFEKEGLIRKFDEYIFRNVCTQQRNWQNQHKLIVPISINLSRISLYFSDIVNTYKKISEEIGIDKSLLPIEITESAAVTNNEIKQITNDFYKAGFKLQMDDFGSGYSSLASLNSMHFDTLKIDKSLIDYIGNFGGDRLLEHTILLAKELGMHVTAEGVEKDTQVAFLKHIGCDSIQGFFYSKPLQKDKFELLLDTNKDVFNTSYDFLSEHITAFKNSMLKLPLYSFIINITENTYYEPSGNCDFMNETEIFDEKFDKAVVKLAENFILPEYKQAYLNFLDRKKIMESYSGMPETRIIEYKRKYNNKITDMRLIAHIFKVKDSDSLWMYETVSFQ